MLSRSPVLDGPPAIACLRCRRRKKKCDRKVPKCGECQRSSVDCIRFQERKARDAAAVPWRYVKSLEARIAQLESQLAFSQGKLTQTQDKGTKSPAASSYVSSTATQSPQPGSRDHESTDQQPLSPMKQQHDDSRLDWLDFDSYIHYVHPSWPFLDEAQLRRWFHVYTTQSAPLRNPELFFLHLVCVIGACYSDRQCPKAFELYHEAITLYLPDAVSLEEFKTRAYLLLIIYALHGPTPFQLHDTTSEAVLEITERLSTFEIPYTFLPFELDAVDDLTIAQDRADRVVLIYCYTAYEIIALLWNGPFQALVRSLDDRILDQGTWLTFGGGSMPADLEHMFGIRRIQSKIRRLWGPCSALLNQEESRRRQMAELRVELEQWKAMIPLVSSTVDGARNYHPLAMLKTYNYCVCCLYLHETILPSIGEYAVLLAAASENCRCFRRIQRVFLVYSTWSGLAEQFNIGIILLSCYWETPLKCRTAAFHTPDALQALEDCQQTLATFAQKWEAAEVYLEAYTLLLSQTPVSAHPVVPPTQSFKESAASIMAELEKRGVIPAILILFARMVRSASSLYSTSRSEDSEQLEPLELHEMVY